MLKRLIKGIAKSVAWLLKGSKVYVDLDDDVEIGIKNKKEF